MLVGHYTTRRTGELYAVTGNAERTRQVAGFVCDQWQPWSGIREALNQARSMDVVMDLLTCGSRKQHLFLGLRPGGVRSATGRTNNRHMKQG